ncbi:MAG TPA: BON domain-containing protein [Rubricoccaceae bacterium]|nr:BON domain-containing protein [Rubricoccaceae bacterium]
MASFSPAVPVPPQIRALVRVLQERRARSSADRALARRLHDAFAAARLEVDGLSLYVHEGAVTLYGMVRTEAHREAVLTLVAQQPGLRRISDHLQLPPA